MATTSRSREPAVLAARRDALQVDARAGRIRRVLAIRFSRLGDVIFTTPALSLLHERLPGVCIDYLAGGPAGALVRHHPAVNEVLRFEPGWHRPNWVLRRPWLVREIARRGYDLALVFESDQPTRDWLERVCARAGVRHVMSRSSLVQPAGLPPAVHSCEKHLRLLTPLGLVPDARPYEVFPGPEDIARADALLRAHAAEAVRPLVGIQAGAHYTRFPDRLLRSVGLRHKTYKAWPAAHWGELARRLVAERGARLVLTGTAGERALAEEIAARAGAPPELAPLVVAGATSVGTLAALVARTDVFVSIDTGTMHLAAALGVPTVALFGPTDSAHHGPYGQRGTARVVRSGIACSPCKKPARKACTLNRCLAELEPKQVLAAVEELL
ncbi:MAG: glycosyltransferase family 9 protein [Myxococcota bacterium]|jgi:ADP-heptose:LPS heptosyltransferase|nr:hypothetical protein [Deltaproteobacteria bacterium]MCP4242268.1 glycosyltransferase family 9 protein [bacterium]MDP6073582.1 glycosyltransferase family 9 protein [Myxococcota bacterium]MDP6242655.1 glycosyltransferase family 9 protein [Myxococcota bacterium]MDP7074244.1 glycosyltransferase family 9 protein [Myxococcota bacterium]